MYFTENLFLPFLILRIYADNAEPPRSSVCYSKYKPW